MEDIEEVKTTDDGQAPCHPHCDPKAFLNICQAIQNILCIFTEVESFVLGALGATLELDFLPAIEIDLLSVGLIERVELSSQLDSIPTIFVG